MSQTYKVVSFDREDAPPVPISHKRNVKAANYDNDNDEDSVPSQRRRGDPSKSFSNKEKRKRELGQTSSKSRHVLLLEA